MILEGEISNGNRTEWSTIQGVIGQVISNLIWFEITSPITPELYDTKSYYQLIVPITKCENLSLGIFINVRNRFQSKKNDWFQLWMCKPNRMMIFFSKKYIFH